MKKKIVLVPDSFKGTMSSTEICGIMQTEIEKALPETEIVSIPVADGGEGSVDCYLAALGGEKVSVRVKNPFMEEIESFYGLVDNGKTAIIEMAACAGLPLIEDRKNPLTASTYGVGQLILAAAERGVSKIIVGLGGSATNDGGCGAASAVSIKFYDSQNKEFVPTGGTLSEIFRIDTSCKNPLLNGVEIITMCDIDNPLCGENGAAHVFGPQKGATPEIVKILDAGLLHMAEIIERDLGISTAEISGAGAAGGMGAGMVAFFSSKLQMGIETLLDTVKFDKVIENADVIFTGEGKIDTQSLRGKVVIGVSRRAKLSGVPVVAVVGAVDDEVSKDSGRLYDEGITAVFSINHAPEDFSIARGKSKENLAFAMRNLLLLIRSK